MKLTGPFISQLSVAVPIHVLVIEDNDGDVKLIQQSFKECSLPVNVTVAHDGEAGLRLLADTTYRPHLVILDLNLPKLPGLEVLAQANRADIAVVIFSSSCSPAEIKSAMELGARECIRKPSDIGAFIYAVCSMLEKWVGAWP